MFSSKASKSGALSWLKHPRHYLFFKIFVWFWLTIIGTGTALVFLSNISVLNLVSNEPLHGPMEKNLAYTARSIERSAYKHNRSLESILSHPRLSKRKLLYLSAEQSDISFTNKETPINIDLSLLNFTKNMPPQIVFTEQYQAFGPVQLTVPEGVFYLYELSSGDLSARAAISTNRKDELGVLGRDFNSMANQLELLISSQKRLLADISHELRSPLTRLKMATGLAQMQANEASQSYLLRIEKEANQLDQMIADVLQVSRLEAKSQTLAMQKQSLNVIVEHVLNDAKFEAKQYDKQLTITGDASVTISCDEALIASALENLLRNAIKYANNIISIKLSHGDAVHIEICDDGPGVPNNQLDKLCEPFFRQSDARDRVSGGTGLGLAIAKNAITAHNGTLVLSNKDQGGLCANITLPIIKE